MAIKSVSIKIKEEMLKKLGFVAYYEGRSLNSHLLVLIRDSIRIYKDANGKIEGKINPAINVKPAKKLITKQEKRAFFRRLLF